MAKFIIYVPVFPHIIFIFGGVSNPVFVFSNFLNFSTWIFVWGRLSVFSAPKWNEAQEVYLDDNFVTLKLTEGTRKNGWKLKMVKFRISDDEEKKKKSKANNSRDIK